METTYGIYLIPSNTQEVSLQNFLGRFTTIEDAGIFGGKILNACALMNPALGAVLVLVGKAGDGWAYVVLDINHGEVSEEHLRRARVGACEHFDTMKGKPA